MRTHKTHATILAAAVLTLSTPAWSAGFALYEVGARPLGLAGAVTALGDDPSAIFFNPAGLATQEGLSIEASLALVTPMFSYDTILPSTGERIEASAETRVFFLPSFYASYRLHDRVAAGIGVYAPFGLGVTWPETFKTSAGTTVPWWGRSIVKQIDLQSVFINPTVALKLHDRVYVGGGFVIAQAAVTLRRAVTQSDDITDDVDLELSADDLGFGGTAGLLVKVIPGKLNVGVSYRSAVSLGFAGNAAFTKGGSPANIPAGLRALLTDGPVTANLTLPHTFSFGIAGFPIDKLTISFNLDVITWSSYEQLAISFDNNPDLGSADEKSWRNTFQLRLGAEYEILQKNLPVRLGFIYDQSPAPDDTVGPELPDTDRYLVALGVGYTWRGLRADLAYQFLISANDDVAQGAPLTLPGQTEDLPTRSAMAHIVSLGLAYKLDI